MTPEEANKIIATFEYDLVGVQEHDIEAYCGILYIANRHWDRCKKIIPYSESLDSLIPVWEKLHELFDIMIEVNMKNSFSEYNVFIEDMYDRFEICNGIGETTQEAAAIATAKVIQEL